MRIPIKGGMTIPNKTRLLTMAHMVIFAGLGLGFLFGKEVLGNSLGAWGSFY